MMHEKNKTYLIAEIGINHNGSKLIAKSLIEASKNAGVDYIKFQYRNLSNCYTGDAKEIGDEILMAELKRSYLAPSEILELVRYAKNIGLGVGISFFLKEDANDFLGNLSDFDFFKVPSPELMNYDLINFLLLQNKNVLISTGAHSEVEIELIFSQIQDRENWVPLHCVSNYPTEIFNAKLGYINWLQQKWGRGVGYSSHDADWRVCIAALALGASWIERHITIDKKMEGLDHTTSSTPDEFKELSIFVKNISPSLLANGPRCVNQGEKINLQNLGRSYYLAKDVEPGKKLVWSDIVYRNPSVGLNSSEIRKYIGMPMLQGGIENQPLTDSVFCEKEVFNELAVKICNQKKIGLPARFHDLNILRDILPVKYFELHLSYGELMGPIDLSIFRSNENYSIHIPDYIGPTDLINPFSDREDIKKRSLDVINNAIKLSKHLSSITLAKVPIVASLSVIDFEKNHFYKLCKQLCEESHCEESFLTLQILPPFAWYFGGSVPIKVFHNQSEWDFLVSHEIPITLDISHLMMSCNYFEIDFQEAFNFLLPITKHVHLSLAEGYDGEGVGFSNLDDESKNIISRVMSLSSVKIVEVWQGHLNNFSGFKNSLTELTQIYQNR